MRYPIYLRQCSIALLGALEHSSLPNDLAQALDEKLRVCITQPEGDLFLLAALIRALSGGTPEQHSSMD
ncbi:hypothetical protein ACT691_13920 [Vibrio metschnikovii]